MLSTDKYLSALCAIFLFYQKLSEFYYSATTISWGKQLNICLFFCLCPYNALTTVLACHASDFRAGIVCLGKKLWLLCVCARPRVCEKCRKGCNDKEGNSVIQLRVSSKIFLAILCFFFTQQFSHYFPVCLS